MDMAQRHAALHVTRRRALTAGLAFLAAPAAVRAQGLTPIKAAGVPEDGVTPALWAEQAGIFRTYGLDVQITPQRSGSATTAGVVGGSYAMGKASIMSIIDARAHGVPVVLVFPGGIYHNNPHSGIIVRADSPIRTGADLNGKVVAVSALSDLYTIGAFAWVDAHGGDWSSLKLVELPIGAVAEAVANGRVDAGNTVEPFLSSAVDGKRVRFLADTDAAIAPEFLLTAWFTTADYARRNGHVIQAFRMAMREAATYANAHHAETVDAFVKFSGMDPGVVAKSVRQLYGTEIDPRLVQPVINDAAKFKVIPAAFDARDFIAPTG
jgi:NitT/TauT family transport system substrate-binding protein